MFYFMLEVVKIKPEMLKFQLATPIPMEKEVV